MDMKSFMEHQIREALTYKWNKGIKIGRDPGPDAISEWINLYAAKYRQEYEECVAQLIKQIAKAAEPRIQTEVCTMCDKEKVQKMSKVVVEEFTRIWFLEMTKPDHDKHVEEL